MRYANEHVEQRLSRNRRLRYYLDYSYRGEDKHDL